MTAKRTVLSFAALVLGDALRALPEGMILLATILNDASCEAGISGANSNGISRKEDRRRWAGTHAVALAFAFVLAKALAFPSPPLRWGAKG